MVSSLSLETNLILITSTKELLFFSNAKRKGTTCIRVQEKCPAGVEGGNKLMTESDNYFMNGNCAINSSPKVNSQCIKITSLLSQAQPMAIIG